MACDPLGLATDKLMISISDRPNRTEPAKNEPKCSGFWKNEHNPNLNWHIFRVWPNRLWLFWHRLKAFRNSFQTVQNSSQSVAQKLKIWTIFVHVDIPVGRDLDKNGPYLQFYDTYCDDFGTVKKKAVSRRFHAVQKSSKSVGSDSKYVPIKVWIVFVFSKSGALWFVFCWFGSVRSVVRSLSSL